VKNGIQWKYTDFDISFGWQTPGNFSKFRQWLLGCHKSEMPGEASPYYYYLLVLSVLGFYLRLHVFGPIEGGNQHLGRGSHG